MRASRGFSLAEILVVTMIFSTLAVASVKFYNGTLHPRELRGKFFVDIESVLSLMHQARANALTSYTVNGSVPTGGFGVHLQRTEINPPVTTATLTATLFVDDYDASISAAGSDEKYTAGQDTVLTTLDIPRAYALQFIDEVATPAVDLTNEAVVIFYAPEAEVKITDNNGNELDEFTVEWRYSSNLTRKLKINRISRFLEIIR